MRFRVCNSLVSVDSEYFFCDRFPYCCFVQVSRRGLRLWNIFETDVSHLYKIDQIDSESIFLTRAHTVLCRRGNRHCLSWESNKLASAKLLQGPSPARKGGTRAILVFTVHVEFRGWPIAGWWYNNDCFTFTALEPEGEEEVCMPPTALS